MKFIRKSCCSRFTIYAKNPCQKWNTMTLLSVSDICMFDRCCFRQLRIRNLKKKMASKSTHSLLDFGENRPIEAIGRSNSSNSLTGESSSASRVKVNGMFVGGVRGMSGAIKMERSEHERAKYPDRINLDRKGLHSKNHHHHHQSSCIPILTYPS